MSKVFQILCLAWLTLLTVLFFATRQQPLEYQLQHFIGAEGVQRDLLADIAAAMQRSTTASNQAQGAIDLALMTPAPSTALKTYCGVQYVRLPYSDRLNIAAHWIDLQPAADDLQLTPESLVTATTILGRQTSSSKWPLSDVMSGGAAVIRLAAAANRKKEGG